jgi:hypothetical protein
MKRVGLGILFFLMGLLLIAAPIEVEFWHAHGGRLGEKGWPYVRILTGASPSIK